MSRGRPSATQATVVPAKAGIQEILRKRACRLPSVLDSGFRRNDGFMRRNDGFMLRLPWLKGSTKEAGAPEATKRVLPTFVGISNVGAGL